ncbi:MAG: hypothetical protein JNN07_21850 [Verrucomicrobiales bacterium]|nr:hypothetical protein [Verrucomicrobiales bacterium]
MDVEKILFSNFGLLFTSALSAAGESWDRLLLGDREASNESMLNQMRYATACGSYVINALALTGSLYIYGWFLRPGYLGVILLAGLMWFVGFLKLYRMKRIRFIDLPPFPRRFYQMAPLLFLLLKIAAEHF